MSKTTSNSYAKAKYDAMEQLIANHHTEYEAILKAEKLKYGITPRLTTTERIALLEQTLENLRAKQ